MSVCGFSTVPDPTEGNLGLHLCQCKDASSKKHPPKSPCAHGLWVPAVLAPPRARPSAGGRSVLAEGPQPLPWGKATPHCSRAPRAPGTASVPARCLLPTAGTCGGGLLAATSPGLTPGYCLLRVCWLLHRPRPSHLAGHAVNHPALPARRGRALHRCLVPALPWHCQRLRGSGGSCPRGAGGVPGLTQAPRSPRSLPGGC